ncbi:peroxisome biogenesis protein 6-like isoform X1 [Ananas comosus]|uniref:Peroxisome biogenesis protein 6-like isoform X1 n=1 Tax=Ananas comosus TaxID=4615 RepID=A0A6P5EZ88_ANACO|nr:peroxisome biogenesis protein 6-like isoform X1 [Ananas comosus]XP_020086528.1 peroxisome biogenesis protein 6-like isoform X1 [Ananas comosus]
MVEGLFKWQDDTKNHFKAKIKLLLELLIRKCGLDAVKAVMPEEHMKLLTNIRKIKDRKERKAKSSDDGELFTARTSISRWSVFLVASKFLSLLSSWESQEIIWKISSTSSMPIEDNNGVDKYETKHLGREDFSRALERSKKRNASTLGTPKLPLMHKHLFSSGLRKRSGVLLYGPPGTGKLRLASRRLNRRRK